MNKEIMQFEQSIVNIINQSGLAIEIKRLVIAEVLVAIETERNRIVASEMKEENTTVEGELCHE